MSEDERYQEATRRLNLITELETSGVLGPEQCPSSWGNSWPVLKPEELPEEFREMYEQTGEVRHYW